MIMKKSEFEAVKKDMRLLVRCVRCGELLQGSHVIVEHECDGVKKAKKKGV